MTAGKTPPLHVLRGILRHIRSAPKEEMPISSISKATILSSSTTPTPTPTPTTQKNPLINHVLSQYRAAQAASPKQATMLRKMAYDFHVLKGDLKERGRLHELDGGAEVKLTPMEMSRLAARRSGLDLPEPYSGPEVA